MALLPPEIVATNSKPHLVDNLRATWRQSAEHITEQVNRFVRLAVAAALANLLPFLATGHFDRKTLFAFLIPVLETAYRQWYPALGAKKADSAPGVTIVPEQVDAAPFPGVTVDPTAPVEQTDNRPRPVDPDLTRPQVPGSIYVGEADADFDPARDPIVAPDESQFDNATTDTDTGEEQA